MNEQDIRQLLEKYKAGAISLETGIEELKKLPYENMGFAQVDIIASSVRGSRR